MCGCVGPPAYREKQTLRMNYPDESSFFQVISI